VGKVKINEVSKEHWKIKIYFSVLFLRTWRSGILFQPDITIFDIYMKGKTCIHVQLLGNSNFRNIAVWWVCSFTHLFFITTNNDKRYFQAFAIF
jgi:hypothetical protein